ncbi:MAG: DUF58 domain-containing protein [Acidimicrobiia bacterium]
MSGAILLVVALVVGALIAAGASPLLPTPRAALAATAVLVAAIGLPGGLVAGLGVVLAAAFLVDAVVARPVPTVTRVVPHQVVRGARTAVTVALDGDHPGLTRVRQPRGAEVLLDPAESDDELHTSLVAPRRGRHTIGPVALRCTGPLGLAAWYRSVGDPVSLVVYPDVPGARRLASAVRQGRFREAGELTRGPLGLGTDFESIRDYLPDDDIRQVNWRATQRQGRPMSNQYRVEQDRTVIGLLDAGRLMAAPIGAQTRLDLALDAFIAVAFVADEVGDRAGVIAFADGIRRQVRPRRRAADAIVRSVFDIEPELTDAAYEVAFRAVGAGKRSLVMIFTDLLDEAAASELLRAIPVLARRHAVMVVSVLDPELEDLVRTPPREPLDVYRAAAALDVLAPRESLRHRLTRLGTIVVEARPEQLAEASVRAYLTAKLRSQL